MSGIINYATGFEDAGITLMDRVEGNGGTNITQASLTSIAYSVYEHSSREDAESGTDGTAIVEDAALTVASVVFDALQTAAPWDTSIDATGYNFRYDSVASDRPNGNRWHRYEIVFTPVSGAQFIVVWVVLSMPIVGS